MRTQFLILISLAMLLFFENCDTPIAQKSNINGEMNYESLVQEKDSPLLFLNVEATMPEKKANESIMYSGAMPVSKENNISGNISNTATHTSFKDATITVNYYSADNALIETSDYVIYKYFEPGTKTKFEIKVNPPDSMRTFDIEIINATAAAQ